MTRSTAQILEVKETHHPHLYQRQHHQSTRLPFRQYQYPFHHDKDKNDQFLPGSIISIVHFSAVENYNKSTNTRTSTIRSSNGPELNNTHAYICKLSTQCSQNKVTTKKDPEVEILTTSANNITFPQDLLMICFDGSISIPLPPVNPHSLEDDHDADGGCTPKQTFVSSVSKQISSIFGDMNCVKQMLYIVEIDPKVQIVNSYNKKNLNSQKNKYCIALKHCPEDLNQVKGCVVSLQGNHVVVPLLSVSLSQLRLLSNNEHRFFNNKGNRKDGNVDDVNDIHKNNDNMNDDPELALLHLCLKRQLMGSILFCSPVPATPIRTTSTTSLLSSSQNEELYVPGNSIAEFNIPHIRSGESELFQYQVQEVLPYHRKSVYSNKFSPSSQNEAHNICLYQVLPSTRITLYSNYLRGGNNLEEHGSNKSNQDDIKTDNCKKRSGTEKTLLNTIDAIRQISVVQNTTLYGRKELGTSPLRKINNCCSFLDIPRVFLLSGSPGVGKTYAVSKAVQTSSEVGPTKLLSIRGSELLSGGVASDATQELITIFNKSVFFASKSNKSVSIIFMDECDALFSSEVVSATMSSLLDQMSSHVRRRKPTEDMELPQNDDAWKRIVVIAATNRIDAIPAPLRRPGRFDRELCISPPNMNERYNILKNLLNDLLENDDRTLERKSTKMKHANTDAPALTDEKGLKHIAELCVGYVPADLASLVRRAAFICIEKGSDNVTIDHLSVSMKDVGASALRDSAISAPPATRWDDIAGDAGGAKTALRRAVEWPKTKRKEFASLGLNPPRGILLHGPPGCAKTTLVRAAAGSAGVAFLSLSPADVYASSYVGEAEVVVRRAFSLARSAAPCILFFDEIDSIIGTSSNCASGMDRGSNAEGRVLSTFLNEMDGVDGSINDGVLVLGATNRPSTLDSAILRPGRFDRVIYVPPPDENGRKQILEAHIHAWQSDGDDPQEKIDVEYLSKDEVTGLMTGAEIVGACREAAMLAIRGYMSSSGAGQNLSDKTKPIVLQRHLEICLQACTPLLTHKLQEYNSFEAENKSII